MRFFGRRWPTPQVPCVFSASATELPLSGARSKPVRGYARASRSSSGLPEYLERIDRHERVALLRRRNKRLSSTQLRPHRLDYLRRRRKNAQYGPGASVDDRLSVDEYSELPVGTTDQLDLSVEFAPQSRRHTDGVQPGHSNRAGADLNSGHGSAPFPMHGV